MNVWYDGKVVTEVKSGVLVLGEAPSAGYGKGKVPLRGQPYKRVLVTDHGMGDLWIDQIWDVMNVIDEPQRKKASGRGSLFPMARAIERLDLSVLGEYDRVVALGARVWDALQSKCEARGWPSEFPSEPRWLDVAKLYEDAPLALRFPHPSGLNHYWNDPVNRERAYEVYRAFVGIVRKE